MTIEQMLSNLHKMAENPSASTPVKLIKKN